MLDFFFEVFFNYDWDVVEEIWNYIVELECNVDFFKCEIWLKLFCGLFFFVECLDLLEIVM